MATRSILVLSTAGLEQPAASLWRSETISMQSGAILERYDLILGWNEEILEQPEANIS